MWHSQKPYSIQLEEGNCTKNPIKITYYFNRSDIGFIKKGNSSFSVNKVHFDNESGVVYHNGKFETEESFVEGDEVTLEVNNQVRQINRRNHSGGHLLET